MPARTGKIVNMILNQRRFSIFILTVESKNMFRNFVNSIKLRVLRYIANPNVTRAYDAEPASTVEASVRAVPHAVSPLTSKTCGTYMTYFFSIIGCQGDRTPVNKGMSPCSEGDKGDRRVAGVCGHSPFRGSKRPFQWGTFFNAL